MIHSEADFERMVAMMNSLLGKRKISATLAGKLGKFFGISPAVFVPA